MSIESRVMMTRVRALGTLLDIEKAAKAGGKFNSAKHPRYPAGNPKGGQFRPKLGMGSGGAEIFMPVYTGSNKIIQSFEAATLAVANQMAQGVMAGAQKLMGMKTHPDDTNNTKLKSTVRQLAAGVAKPDAVPGVAVTSTPVGTHPQLDTNGKPVTIKTPTTPSDPATWNNASAMAVFTPHSDAPDSLNGVAFTEFKAPKDAAGWQALADQNKITEPDTAGVAGAGVLIREPDGRVWAVEPTNHFGGYDNSFPKGGKEAGMDLQATALKETFEESGLQVKLTGVLGDYKGTTGTTARYYLAERIGGTPKAMGWETQSVKLVPESVLGTIMNQPRDQKIAADLAAKGKADATQTVAPKVEPTPVVAPAPPTAKPATATTFPVVVKDNKSGSDKWKSLTISDDGNKELGKMTVAFKKDLNVWQVQVVIVDGSSQGQGLGKSLYKKAIDIASKDGVPLVSDKSVSDAANNVWLSLKKEGYPVVQSPQTKFDGKFHENSSGGPVWTLDPGVKPATSPSAVSAGALGDPPKIASASNPAYQKKIDGLYASVKAGDTGALDAFIPLQQAKVDAAKLKPTLNAHDKWNAQLLTAAVELKAKATGAKIDATVTASTTPAVKPAPAAVKPEPAPVVASAVPVKPKADANSPKRIYVDIIEQKGLSGLSGSSMDKLIATHGIEGYANSTDAEIKAYAQAWLSHLNANGTPAAVPPTMKPVMAITPAAVKPVATPVAAVPVKPDTTGDWSATGQIKTIDKIVTGDGNGYKKENAIPTLNNYLLSSLITPQAKQYAQAWIDHLSAQGKTSPVATAKPTPAPVVTATATAAVISAPKGIGSKAHQQYTKQGDAVYQAALAGDKATVDGFVAQYQAKIDAAKLKPNYPTFADGQYNKLLAYSQKVQAEMQTAATAGLPATAPKSALTKTKLTLAEMTQVGGKPGGSNPGGIYQDADGAKWLVKGSNKPDPDGGPARNEVLASRLYNAAGGFAPEMRTVDMGAQYGGGIGVASKMQDGFTKLDANNPAHIAKVREDFAMDAWLANWDAVGMDFDNTVIDKNGNAMRIDPGGALLYRAQGEPKGADFGKTVNEWDGMRDPSKNPQAAKIFAGMTDSELKASAAKVAAISDSTIQTLVNRYGPGDAAVKAALADTLIARKQDVIAKAGMIGATTTAVVSTVAVAPAAGAGFKLDAGTVQGMANKTANQVEALANGKLTLANLTDAQFNRIADGLTAMDTAEINAWGQAVIGDKFKALPGTATIDIPSKAEATALLTNMANADAFAAPATTPVSASTSPVKPDLTGLADSDKTLIGVIENLATKSDPIYASMTDTQIKETLGGFATTKNASLMSPAVTQYAQAWLDHLNAGGTTTAATAKPATVTPTATIKPALPNFNAAKLASTNSNAPGINAKIDKIASLANAGDANGLLALNYGSNTYAKKTVALANDALAALGSTEKVVAGQKSNTHPAIGTATVAKTPPVKPVVATGEKGLVDLIETVATGKGAIKDPDEIVKNLALKASWGGDAGKYAEAWLDHMGYTHDGIGNATPKTATAATPTSTPGSLTGAFKSTPAAPAAKTPAQTLAADIKALATKLKDEDADGGISTFKLQLDAYGTSDPGFVKTYLGIAAKSKDYSPEVNAFAQKSLDMPDGVNALITAWNAPDGTTATPVAGAWGNQYGAGIDGVTTRVTALGMAAAKPRLDPAKLEPPADYNNFNGPGKGLSSSADKNDASNKIAQELYTLAANGDMAALKAYDVDSKTTSSQTKGVVGAYKNQLVGQIENMLNPPPPVATWKIGGKVSAENVTAALTTAFPKHAQYKESFANKSNLIGRFGVMGSVTSKSMDKIVTAAKDIPDVSFDKGNLPLAPIYDEHMASYKSLTAKQQENIRLYTNGKYTSWNKVISSGKLTPSVKSAMQAIEQAAVDLPPGTILGRGFRFNTDVTKSNNALLASKGKVLQDFGITSTAYNAGWDKPWDGVKIRYKTLPGAKGLFVDYPKDNDGNLIPGKKAITANPGEKEFMLSPKARLLVTRVEKTNYDEAYWGKYSDHAVYMDVLLLPEDATGSSLDTF